MAAMAIDRDHGPASSPAPPARLPAPPYHHSPAATGEEEVATPPRKSAAGQRSSPMPSPLQLSGCSLQELLLMSPPPPGSRRNRSRQRGGAGAGLDESLEMVAAAAGTPPRRRRRAGGEQCAAPAVASPRNGRRARRRVEKEIEVEDDAARRARRRKSTRAAPKAAPAAAEKAAAADKEDKSMALVLASTDAIRGADALEQSGWEDLWERVVELVMWKNVAKSALWFGLGSMFFFSCSFSREVTFSPISVLCQMGVIVLGLAFIKDSVHQKYDRQQVERGRSFRLTEEDVLRAARAVLPVANSMISTAQVIFSGDPSMTLKALPILLFGAKYGSLVTVWRFLATGFFTSFAIPKLYSCYSSQIHKRVEVLRDQALEAWKSCPRKKLVAGTAVTMCWNLFSVKTRIIAAFISIVILRYNQKYRKAFMNTEHESCPDEQGQKMEIED
ncbi:reticulon-like protein B17 [Oryza brachyantha]|uniref:reticulon-like protein B17 n=1 Tax=Oryza brachyantha TaxID=4533 RepID=UPI001ADAB402|nr:reticulon-like protein B17 [Oryza brachyantha]